MENFCHYFDELLTHLLINLLALWDCHGESFYTTHEREYKERSLNPIRWREFNFPMALKGNSSALPKS